MMIVAHDIRRGDRVVRGDKGMLVALTASCLMRSSSALWSASLVCRRFKVIFGQCCE
jgi:hypothetical protein